METTLLQHPASRTIVALIGITGILCNGLVLLVYFRRRKSSQRTSFDIFIINLAVADFLAGIFIFSSRFFFQPQIPENYTSAMTYCYLLWGAYLLHGLMYVSIYACLALTIERWLAIMRPHFYWRVKPKHAMVAMIFVWVWAFLINATMFFSIDANFDKRSCYWVEPKIERAFVAFIDISMLGFLPFIIIILLYCQVYNRIRQVRNFRGPKEYLRKRRTIIALIASVFLTVAWLPTIIYFNAAKEKHLDGNLHSVLNILSLSTIIVNPILYGIYSSKFRNEYKQVFTDVFRKLLECVGACKEQVDAA
ncbi:somatostatin receptor type 5-like [Dendronephthya gigantea]|uniref:somatostatin receptor type 5-like n=1 Tax=Dendronephthya gigantea TaxID=151771 RepID=UPI00106D441F|nr:somatostatin receptor type 5-like [Dendronephthya gigantea]